jgi:hypothetical protein
MVAERNGTLRIVVTALVAITITAALFLALG